MPYKLSATLSSHTSDVRAVCSPRNDVVLSASRDSTAIVWKRASTGTTTSFTPASSFRPGSRFVNAVTYLPPSSEGHPGYLAAGGQDCTINIFTLDSTRDDPDYTLIGHSDNVCALDTSSDGTIISGSWDRTAKVWKDFQLVYDLKGHQQSVWAVLALNDERFLTGSADKTIRLWQQHKMMQSYTGHHDAVRGLALVPDVGFASCSNDGEIRVWTMHGDSVYTLSGHTSFVYSLSVLPSGDIISGGEDRTVRVWSDGECLQTLVHPAISVWSVSSMPNGDIVSGCSDGVVRVFSAAEERWASAEDIQSYDQKVASQALPSQQVGDIKKSDLGGLEALQIPGKKSGEVKMIKNGELVEAFQWDTSTSTWQKIGDVVDAVGQGRRQLYQGKEYDYVFDVDIQDGVPPLKLPYNATDNPYSAAQKFLESNELPLTYIDEVVKFIEKNTAGVNIGTSGNDYVDPYTGASRYQSSASPAAYSQPAASYIDPYTGASRYTGVTQSQLPSSDFADPFTGASRYQAAGSQASSSPVAVSKILPVTQCVHFKQANIVAMQSKLTQFNNDLRQQLTTSSLSMSPEELGRVDDAFAVLTQLLASPSSPKSKALDVTHVTTVIEILERWPISQCFPVIDLGRMIIGCCPEAFSSVEVKDKFFDAVFNACEWDKPSEVSPSKSKDTNMLLLLRTLANAFHENQPKVAEVWISKSLSRLGRLQYSPLSKLQRVALSTLAFNISCTRLSQPAAFTPIASNHLSLILLILRHETSDSEAVYRALVALGNIVYFSKRAKIAKDASEDAEIRQTLVTVMQAFSEDRVKNVTNEILSLL